MRMFFAPRPEEAYSRAERLSDAGVHVAGLVAVAVGVPALVTLAVGLRGDLPAVLGAAVYGATLFAMILCSALYHMVPRPGWKGVLRRLDHSAIYWKIAGTYTPFTVLSGQGAGLLAGLWGAAAFGTALRVFAAGRFRWLALSLYLAMGWAGLVAGWPMLETLSGSVLALIVTGGVLYTVGMVFFLLESLPFHNTIWHGFVLAASLLFFVAVTLHLVETAT